MRQTENISAVAALEISLLGFIFHPCSPRYVSGTLPPTPDRIGRVGVFVNASFDTIVHLAQRHELNHLQLHGEESPELCLKLKEAGYIVIKAFQIEDFESFMRCREYEQAVDMLLFDTASGSYGGSGRRFDWSLLNTYTGKRPYILSGGISVSDTSDILQITDSRFWGIDLNSRFEHAPAIKDIKLLEQFINQLKQQ